MTLPKYWRFFVSIYLALIGAESTSSNSNKKLYYIIFLGFMFLFFSVPLTKGTYKTRKHIEQLKSCYAVSQCKMIQTPVIHFVKSYKRSKHGFWELWFKIEGQAQSDPIASRYRGYDRYAYKAGDLVPIIVYPSDIRRSDTLEYVNNPPSYGSTIMILLFSCLAFRVSYDLAKAKWKRSQLHLKK